MLQMKEALDRALVERVATELYNQLSPSIEYKASLEVLSSLAQRRAPEFGPAREIFIRAVDRLAGAYGESGASALESALATSPEAAMKVIPGLLRHQSPRWKEAAVQLLRDIGTDEALDRLVQLLSDKDLVVRNKTAKMLAGMLKGRQSDLRRRAALLPQRADAIVWPLEKYFPGNLAIAIAESLSEPVTTSSEAINCAARALRERQTGVASSFLRQWRHVARDLKLRWWRHQAGRFAFLSGCALSLGFLLTLAALQIWGYWTNQAMVLTLMPTQVYGIDSDLLDQVRNQAKVITADIEQRFPPNASGPSRILPWNWSVEPVLPEGKDKVYETIKQWGFKAEPDTLSNSAPALQDIAELTSYDNASLLHAKIAALQSHLPDVQNTSHALARPDFFPVVPFLMLLYPLIFLTRFNPFFFYPHQLRIVIENRFIRKVKLNQIGNFDRKSGPFNFALILSIVFVTYFYIVSLEGVKRIWILPLLSTLIGIGVGVFLQRLKWPDNPLLFISD